MFTGLIADIGTVERILPGEGVTDCWIQTNLNKPALELGESIAIDGTCLTIVERAHQNFRVQASVETLRRTTLGQLEQGSRVNLERAMTLSDRLGGHLVSGHIDAITSVLEKRSEGEAMVMAFGLPEGLAPYFIEKGSVAIDGVSLTINELGADRFKVMLIPETQKRTALALKNKGDQVNLEVDLIGKYVARILELRDIKVSK